MPAGRPYWKGYIKLALVSCPIAVYTASSSTERVAFRQVNKLTGNRLRQQLVDEETREVVDAADKGRGYEIGKNKYLMIDEEELESVEIESNHTIEIDSFVPRSEIDERYFDSPYYIALNEKGGVEAFALIREAMLGKSVAALGRVVLSKRERVIMLQPWEKGLLGTTLRYPHEVRPAKDYFDDIPNVKIDSEMLSLAEHILKSKQAHFEPPKFVDRYEDAVVDMLKKKHEGLPIEEAKPFIRPANVVNLMDALRASIAGEKAAGTGSLPAKPSKTRSGKAAPAAKGRKKAG